MDSIVAEAPDINMTEAASLVEFSESVFSLARSGAAGGETGEDGQSWTVGPRASLAFQQDRLLEAAQLLETFPALSGTDALARVPALSGAGTLVGAPSATRRTSSPTRRRPPRYTTTSTDTIAGAEALAVQFDAVGASEGEGACGWRSPCRSCCTDCGKAAADRAGAGGRSARGYGAGEPHGRVITEMMQDWAMGRDTLLLPAGAGKSRLVVELCNRLGWGTRDIKVFPLFETSRRATCCRRAIRTRTATRLGTCSLLRQRTPIVLDNLHAARADVALGSLSDQADREVGATAPFSAQRMPLRQGVRSRPRL